MSAAPDVTPRKALSILIIQLGEIEEVFRSLMAVKAVKHLYPEMKFRFVVRYGASAPIRGVEWVEHCYEVPRIHDQDGLKVMARWVDQVIEVHYDLLCNWTDSLPQRKTSSIITSLIPAMIKLGHYFKNDDTIGCFDAWSIYRDAWLGDPKIDQEIHPTDIITTQLLTALQIHAGEPVSDSGTQSVTTRNFFRITEKKKLPETAKKWIAFHPDSLDSRFGELAEMILRRHPEWGVVLINDTPWVEKSEILASNPRVIDLCGTLNFETLTDALSQCAWLVSGRAPVVELSNLLNVRTLYWIEAQPQITGEARYKWTESGPYGNGNIAVRFDGDFLPESFYAIWSHFQSEWYHQGKVTLQGHFENLGLSASMKKAEVYRSRIRQPQEGGGVTFEPILDEETAFEFWMFRLRGQLARSWFCGWIPSIEEEVSRMKLNSDLIRKVRALQEPLRTLEQIALQGQRTAAELARISSQIKNPRIMPVEDRQSLDLEAAKIREIESLLSRVSALEPSLAALESWYLHLLHHLTGTTISQMAKENVHAFQLLADGASLMKTYVTRVLDQAKPKSITLSEQIAPLKEN